MRQFIADHKAGIIWIGSILLVLLVIALIFGGGYWYFGHWGWTGVIPYEVKLGSGAAINYAGKTLWDWLDLLIVPLVLAIGGFLLNRAQRQSEQKIAEAQREQDRDLAEKVREQEREIAKEREEERALQSYLDAMTALLLKERLRESEEDSEVRSVARSRTLTVLRGLSEVRKASVLRFLYESKLINTENTVINLQGADLSEAGLSEADLSNANLRGANLSGANLREAKLGGARLSGANLSKANLSKAKLGGARLSGANLSKANLSEAFLRGAFLEEANLREANLREANLIGADLQGVSLSRVKLIEASLIGTDLQGVNIIRAGLGEADLSNANLEGATYNTELHEDEFRYTYRPTRWPDNFDPVAAGAIDVSKAGE